MVNFFTFSNRKKCSAPQNRDEAYTPRYHPHCARGATLILNADKTSRVCRKLKTVPEPPSDAGAGVDATVSEGWLDLRLRNDTDEPYQITVTFDDDHIIGGVRAQRDPAEISQMLDKIGKQSRFVNGLRYTDAETMDIVQMVLSGKVNKDLVSLIQKKGGSAVGLCGLDGSLIQAKKLEEPGNQVAARFLSFDWGT